MHISIHKLNFLLKLLLSFIWSIFEIQHYIYFHIYIMITRVRVHLHTP